MLVLPGISRLSTSGYSRAYLPVWEGPKPLLKNEMFV